MADIITAEDEGIAAPQMGGGGFGSANAATASAVRKNTKYAELFTAKAKNLVKGVGHVTNDGQPLSDVHHGAEIMTRSHDAIMKSRAAAIQGSMETDSVVSGISSEFWDHPQAGAMKFMAERDSMVRKNFTAGNLALSGTPYGLVPFDLNGVLAS